MVIRGRTGNLLIPCLLLSFVGGFLLLGKYYWGYAPNVLMFPLVTGILVIASSVWLLVRAATIPVESLIDEGESIGESEDPRCSLGKRLAWIASVYPLGYFLGLILGLVLFALAYTSYHRLPWWQRLVTAAIVFSFVYIGFYKLLGVSSLPVAPLWMR
jgi:hypothetical protein